MRGTPVEQAAASSSAPTLPEPGTVALQGCLRQALCVVLPRDDVEVSGHVGRVERLHEDRTCTVSFPSDHVPPAAAAAQPAPVEDQRRLVAVEVRAGALIDLLRFLFSDGSVTDCGEEGGALVGRFDLEEGEAICRVTGTSGDSLDSVQFHTSRARSSEVFGNALGGTPFAFAAPPGRVVLGVRRGAGRCAALRGLVCSGPEPAALRSGQQVEVSGLVSAGGQALNGLRGTVQGGVAGGRFAVALEGFTEPKALKAENLITLPGRPELRVLLRDCSLREPRGNFQRRRRQQREFQALRWRGLCGLDWNGRSAVDGRSGGALVGREGVHHVLRVAAGDPIPVGVQVTSLQMHVTGMDQGWGNSGDSGVVLYVQRAGAEAAAPWDAEEPLAKVTFDHNRHPSHEHSIQVRGLHGPLAPQPGDRLEATLHCPNYPGWNAHAKEVAVTVRCLSEQEEALPGELPTGWEARAAEAFDFLNEHLGDDSRLDVDASHLSLRGQERQHVWAATGATAEEIEGTCTGPVAPRLAAACRGHCSSAGAERLLGKLDANTPTAGAPQDPQLRKARYRNLCVRVHRTLDALAKQGDQQHFLSTVCAHYADAASECIYRWEREIANMHDLVTGESTSADAVDAEDAVLRLLCDARRQLAEAALHRAKGAAGNSDMHFESFFYGSIHFGLPEQLEAARDPNRLNYGSLNMLQPAAVQRELMAAYTPAAIRDIVRARAFESTAPGAQALREKLLDWFRGHVPPGFRPLEHNTAARQEAWLFEQCHDEGFRLRDWALNFMLCGMHVLRPDRLACLVGDAADLAAVVEGTDDDSGERHAVAQDQSGRRCTVQ